MVLKCYEINAVFGNDSMQFLAQQQAKQILRRKQQMATLFWLGTSIHYVTAKNWYTCPNW